MSTTTEQGAKTVALLGNPNTGKSTLFGALVGVRQRVGNYPGVTVEKKIGHLDAGDRHFTLVDLPGTYSLAPQSPDEMIAVDVLLGRREDVPRPDAVICIVDASNLHRNLYLVSQVLELGVPTIVALNKTDVAADRGIAVDAARLGRQLGAPVVPTQAHRKIGLPELIEALCAAAGDGASSTVQSPLPQVFRREAAALEAEIGSAAGIPLPRYLAGRLLLDVSGYLEKTVLRRADERARACVAAARKRLLEAGCPIPSVETDARYGWVDEVIDGVVTRPEVRKITLSDRLDRVLMHKVFGTLIFVVVMIVVFQAIFAWAAPVMSGIEWAVERAADWATAEMSEGPVKSLLASGVFAGVGSVLVFLPQILILFLFLAILEDCGYMARAAYLMDGWMSRVGLSGKSFIPLLSCFACAVPGIMATRVIENRRDRLATILVAPLMSCSARLPIYTLLIAAFIPPKTYLAGWLGLQAVTMFAMYLVGIVAAVVVALILKKTIFRGGTPSFVMELPSYKLPSVRTVLGRMATSGWAFVRRAGTIIFAVTVIVWAAAYFPHPPEVRTEVESRYGEQMAGVQGEQLASLRERIADEVAGAYMEQSFLGRAGRWIEPVVRPLGWDWRIGCAVIASLPAREVVIGSMGVIYNLGEGQDAESESLRKRLRRERWGENGEKRFNIPIALSLMVFYALCAQCAATLIVVWRETKRWVWPVFTFTYMTVLAYLGAMATYQVGMLFVSST